jgi:glycosyltransferase involved in cell wall biosynthesis
MYFSIIIPLYNRPQEIDELLGTLTLQTYKAFEVLVIEDGSTQRAEDIVNSYADKLDVKYFEKAKRRPGLYPQLWF